MKRTFLSILLLNTCGLTLAHAHAWHKDSIATVMHNVARWEMQQPPKYPTRDWHYGTWYAGLMALYETTRDPSYYDELCRMASRHAWKTLPDIYDADRLMVVQTYLDLFRLEPDSNRIRHAQWILDAHIGRRPESDVRFTDNPYRREWWSWCDALFMAPPAFAKLYALTGDDRYLRYLEAHWWKTSEYLYARPERLFYRDDRFFSPRSANGANVFWSRGNGWVIAALARMLTDLPGDFPGRARFEQQFVEMADAIAALQGQDGLWRASLLDADAFPEPESSSTALFCYGFAWGIRTGLLAETTYLPIVKKAWAGLCSHVSPEGRLGFAQPPGIEPKGSAQHNSEPYGTGAFLLAGTEILKLLGEQPGNVAYRKGTLLYGDALTDTTKLAHWVMEGPGTWQVIDGWMEMQADHAEWHHVFWCPKTFPDRFIAEWDVQNLHRDAGLLIVFFAASGKNAKTIFDPSLPPRDGTFSGYTKGCIDNYHISYYANNPKNPARELAHLRKNSGFALVHTGMEGIPKTSPAMHRARLVKDGGHILFFIDGRKIIDWQDDGKTLGPVHGPGKIGFRQMQWSHFRYRDFNVWDLVTTPRHRT